MGRHGQQGCAGIGIRVTEVSSYARFVLQCCKLFVLHVLRKSFFQRSLTARNHHPSYESYSKPKNGAECNVSILVVLLVRGRCLQMRASFAVHDPSLHPLRQLGKAAVLFSLFSFRFFFSLSFANTQRRNPWVAVTWLVFAC